MQVYNDGCLLFADFSQFVIKNGERLNIYEFQPNLNLHFLFMSFILLRRIVPELDLKEET